jgi:hypothetical protein
VAAGRPPLRCDRDQGGTAARLSGSWPAPA